MKCDIVLAGVGGQGIVSIATVIGFAAIESGLHLKQAEVHGMSQRGGAVLSHLRISDKEIYSELVPEGRADLILSAEPMESLRYLPFLSDQGWIVTNSNPYINIHNYPDINGVWEEIKKNKKSLIFDADKMAKELGNPRGANMVIAGAASLFIDIPFNKMMSGVDFIFGRKGSAVVEKNVAALKVGRQFAEKNRSI